VTALLDYWKRNPSIGVLVALSLVFIPFGLVWTAARVYLPVMTGEMPFITDFSFYYEAVERYLQGGPLYPDPFGYMYPPPSVVLFLPLVALPVPASFLLSVVAIGALAAVCIELTLRLWETGRGEAVGFPLRVLLWLIGFAAAPVFHNLKYGQVNVFVLAIGLGFLWLLQKDRPFAAALVLSVGFWLKLYPLALALLGLRRGWIRGGTLGLAVGLVVVPVVLLPVVPAELYRQYAFDLVPYWAEVTNMHALNQSITGVLERMALPLTDYLRSHDTPIGAVTHTVNVAATVGLLGALYGAYFLRRVRFDLVGVGVLAVLPVISALGWEHTYVLALPLYLYALLEAQRRGPAARWLAAFAVFVFMIPKPPEEVMIWTFEHWPRAVVDVFYARFLVVTLLLLGAAVVWLWTRGPQTTSAPAAEPPGRSRREAAAGVSR
jgi:hypothetical protein